MENLIQLRRKKDLIEEYAESLSGKSDKTVDAYIRAVRQLTEWIAGRPGIAQGYLDRNNSRKQ
ncbi:hypothetical protein ACPCXE_06365 [Bacillus velezensis]|uniref:hypothetical protein n=1 Tax=Bacillus velezensis TaxID=492670 RepID=UPI0013D33905|nr:hypothetical protein [Bacillus velezensis]MEC2277225.1 hypothetical protein [Bacillus velezensis]MEC2312053.1 hypothetical protein [Bacillus velezensis]MED3700905.1 hypothetical protein [Bacillus velezensis]